MGDGVWIVTSVKQVNLTWKGWSLSKWTGMNWYDRSRLVVQGTCIKFQPPRE